MVGWETKEEMKTRKRSEQILTETESLCPECLQRIPAVRVRVNGNIVLRKHCEEHGTSEVVIWRGEPAFDGWVRPKVPSRPKVAYHPVEKGCPFDCGLCDDHHQHTCTALLEVTQRCNLSCPVCFASSEGKKGIDPGLDVIESWYERVMTASGNCNIQLSGGEPTIRNDVVEIVALGRKKGFSFIQLNTNGLRLAADPNHAQRLQDAGLSSVFLQFDGTEGEIHKKLRGKDLVDEKRKAIEACARSGIGVVLVPTIVPGINDGNIGEIIKQAMAYAPEVRGVHFQPVSYFGRYPVVPMNASRITLPEIVTAVVEQTSRLCSKEDFLPPGCEHALCSFMERLSSCPTNR